MSTIRPIRKAPAPIRGVATIPGSKSLTNRFLALAALADGVTTVHGALFADDTARMRDCLAGLGFAVQSDEAAGAIEVTGAGGRIPAGDARLFVGNSGTTARFLTPILSLGSGDFVVDGVPRMRERPIGDLLGALCALGVSAQSLEREGFPPIQIRANGLHGGSCRIRADASSQFLSGLLLAAPCADADSTEILVDGPLLSAPYVWMTVECIRRFGAVIDVDEDGRRYVVPGRQRYKSPGVVQVEPDASSASYFFAAAAVTGGSVRIDGLGKGALQGDVAFVDILERMGCIVERASDSMTVSGPAKLHGVTADMNSISDTVMTVAAIAPFADAPTVIENVAHIRHKETDRLTAVATELQRLGVRVDERADGLTIYPAERLTPAVVQTYDDHRMAMAFAICGLAADGVAIHDPGCVAKTFPDFFERLDKLVESSEVTA